MSRCSIVQVIETNGPGGAETVLAELASSVSAQRFRSVMVFPSHDGWLGRVRTGAEVRFAEPTVQRVGGLPDTKYLSRLRGIFTRERAGLVHAHSFDTAFYCTVASVGMSTPVIATFHGSVDVRRRSATDVLKWAVLSRLRAFVCVSESLASELRTLKRVCSARIHVIHNGVDTRRFRSNPHRRLRDSLGIGARGVLIGALGNIRAAKGYDVLIEAVRRVRQSGGDVYLAIAGDDRGDLATQLRAQVRELDILQYVHFLGFRDDAAEFLNGIDLLVLPSLTEGFSLSTAQAMASGLPVIATKSGGPEELVEDGRSGVLVVPGSPVALAEAVVGLVNDAGRRASMGREAERRARSRFSIEQMISRYEDLYDQLALVR